MGRPFPQKGEPAATPFGRNFPPARSMDERVTTTAFPDGSSGPLDELRVRLITELRERLLEQALSLPLGNQAALGRVAELCRTETATAQEIAGTASLDEGLATTLLRVANSAALGGAAHIDDLPTAVTRLGFRFVECLALSAPCLRLLAAPSDGLEDARLALHQHAVRTGVLARAIAPGGIHPDRALSAGLVHNLGLSILSLHARSGFRKLLDAASEGEQFPEVERRLFGFTHAELGALLARQWSFPDSIVMAIEGHDAPTPPSQLAALVQVADLLVREAGWGVEPPAPVSQAAATAAGVDLAEARASAATTLASDRADASEEDGPGLTAVLETIA